MTFEIEEIYTWPTDVIFICIRYFIISGVAYFIFYVWKRKAFRHLRIQAKMPSIGFIKKEIFHSASTLVIYCGVSWLAFYLRGLGYTKVYLNIDDYGYSYFVLSVLIMIILHDTYFYWTHRIMHHPSIYHRVHRTHHISQNPTPWAAFSFHPYEALISTGHIPIILFFIPSHPYALFTFLSYMSFMNVLGHLGYEIFPRKFRESKIGVWHNASTYHHKHHEDFNTNFGLYFTFWDKLMKTFNYHPK